MRRAKIGIFRKRCEGVELEKRLADLEAKLEANEEYLAKLGTAVAEFTKWTKASIDLIYLLIEEGKNNDN